MIAGLMRGIGSVSTVAHDGCPRWVIRGTFSTGLATEAGRCHSSESSVPMPVAGWYRRSAGVLPSRHAPTGTAIVGTAVADTVVGDEQLARIAVECPQRHPGRREEVLANGCKAPRREWERAA